MRAGLSAWALENPGRESLGLAVRHDPDNPKLHHCFGQWLLYQAGFKFAEFQQARDSFERAAALAPNNAAIWSDLAAVCTSLADTAGAGRALDHALALDPMTPRLRWFAGNLQAGRGEAEPAFRHFRALLQLDPLYAPEVFEVGARLTGDPSLLESRLTPAAHQAEVGLALLTFLARDGQLDAAGRLWPNIATPHASFPFSSAHFYLEGLIAAGDVAQTTRVWGDLIRLGIISASPGEPGNSVFNGGFEQWPLNGGLDWRWFAHQGVWLDFSDRVAYSGKRSLRVDFVGERNEVYELVAQMVPVTAGQEYRLAAWVCSRAITSDSGPRLWVTDPDFPSRPPVETAATVGTTPWHRVESTFKAGPAQRFARVSLWRPRSRGFPNQITGQFWLDAVSLEQVGIPVPKNRKQINADRTDKSRSAFIPFLCVHLRPSVFPARFGVAVQPAAPNAAP